MSVAETTRTMRATDAAAAARERADLRFRSITESAVDAFITFDAKGRICGWNAAASRIFGWSEGEAVGMMLTSLMPERARAAHNEARTQFLRTGKGNKVGRTLELAGLRKNGVEFPCEISISTWTDGSERFFTSIFRDVSGRKRVEERIARASRDFRTVVDAVPRPIIVSRDGFIVFVNRVFCLWYGIESPGPLIGKPVSGLLATPTHRTHLAERMTRVQKGEIAPEQTWLLRVADGSIRTVDVASVAVEFDGAPAIVAIYNEVIDQDE